MSDTAAMIQPRRAGRTGRRRSSHEPRLRMKLFFAAPEAPPTFDATKGATQWGMLGNDAHSDCGGAAFEHGRMVKALTGANPDGTPIFAPGFVPPTTDGTLGVYYDYGIAMGEGPPGSQPDSGVENATFFPWLLKESGTEHDDDEVACAELDANDENEIKFWVANGLGVVVGCSLTDSAQTEFANGQPWTISAQEQPDPQLGHDVYLVAYGPDGYVVLTWGAPQRCTVDWETGEVSAGDLEVWLFLTRADARRAGMTDAQFDALLAACRQIGGSVAPNAAPPPAPGPAPAPVVTPPTDPSPIAEVLADLRDVGRRAGAVLSELAETVARALEKL